MIRMPSLSTFIIMNTTQTLLKARSETSMGHPIRILFNHSLPMPPLHDLGKDSDQSINPLPPTP